MKKPFIILFMILSPLFWRGAGGEAFSQDTDTTNTDGDAPPVVKNMKGFQQVRSLPINTLLTYTMGMA
ncbi:MAG: hypothetical protein ACYDCN_09820 [Bacteroidia bacterium]